MRKVVVSFKLTPELKARLEAWHARTRIPKAVAAGEALTAYLDAAEREAAAAPVKRKTGKR
jgi:predicted transcriptional regulator